MSITASYRRFTPDEFQKFQDDPKAAAAVGLVNLEFLEDDFDYQADLEQKGRYLDIDRQWHALHFLLTGKNEMGSNLRDSAFADNRRSQSHRIPAGRDQSGGFTSS